MITLHGRAAAQVHRDHKQRVLQAHTHTPPSTPRQRRRQLQCTTPPKDKGKALPSPSKKPANKRTKHSWRASKPMTSSIHIQTRIQTTFPSPPQTYRATQRSMALTPTSTSKMSTGNSWQSGSLQMAWES